MAGSILVTGAGGCIGSWVLRQLTAEGQSVVALDLKKDSRRAELLMDTDSLSAITWEQGDIADSDRLTEVLKKHDVSAIIHLAALQVPFCKADPRTGAKVNVVGTVNVFEAARELGIKRITYASSVAAHGVADAPWLKTLYGAYKLCNEHLAEVYWQDSQVGSLGIRPNVVYGPARDQGMSSLPTLAILAGVLDQPFEVPFSGPVGFLYAKEAAAGFVAAVAADNEGAPVYDFNGTSNTVEELIAITKTHCPSASLTCTGQALPFPPNLDDRPLREALGEFPAWSLESGIAETIDTFRSLVDAGKLGIKDLTPGGG